MLVLSTVFLYLFENTDYTCLIFNFSFILSFWPSNSSLCNVRQRDLPHIGDFLTLPSLLNYTLWISLHSSNTTLRDRILHSSSVVLAAMVGKGGSQENLLLFTFYNSKVRVPFCSFPTVHFPTIWSCAGGTVAVVSY